MVMTSSHSHSSSTVSSSMQPNPRPHSSLSHKHNKSASAFSPSSSPSESPASTQRNQKAPSRMGQAKHSDSYLHSVILSTPPFNSSPASSTASSPSNSPFLQSFHSPLGNPSTATPSPASSLPGSPLPYAYNIISHVFPPSPDHESIRDSNRDSLSSLSSRHFETPLRSSRRNSLRHHSSSSSSSNKETRPDGGVPLNARKLNAFLDLGTCDGNESDGLGLCLGGKNRVCPYTDLKTPSLAQLARINAMSEEQRPARLEDIADAIEDKWPMQNYVEKDDQIEGVVSRKQIPSLEEALRMLNPNKGERIERLILPVSSSYSSSSFSSLSASIRNGACIPCAVYLVTFPDSSSAAYHWLLAHGPVEYADQLVNRLREKTLHKKQDIRFSTLWLKLAKEAAKTIPYSEGMSASDCKEEKENTKSSGISSKSKANDEISREILVGFFESFKNVNYSGEVLHRQNFQRIEFDLYDMLKRHQITKEEWKIARNSFALHSFKPFVDREEKEVQAYFAENQSDDEEEIESSYGVPSPTLSSSSSFSSNSSFSSASSSSSSSSSSSLHRKRPSIRLCGKTLFTFNVVSGELTCIASCSQVAAEDSRYCAVCIHKVLQKKRMLTCVNYRDCNNHAYQGAHVILNVLAQRENLSKAVKSQLRLCQFCMIQEQFRLLDDEIAYGEGQAVEGHSEVERLQKMKAKMDANMDQVAGEMVANVLDEEEVKIPEVVQKVSKVNDEYDREEEEEKKFSHYRYPQAPQNNYSRAQSPNQPVSQQYPSVNHSTYSLTNTPPHSSTPHYSHVKATEANALLEEKHAHFTPASVAAPISALSYSKNHPVFIPYPALPAGSSYASKRSAQNISPLTNNQSQEYPRFVNHTVNRWTHANPQRATFVQSPTFAG